jgi:hypothetical protein
VPTAVVVARARLNTTINGLREMRPMVSSMIWRYSGWERRRL